jgi:hypothetical protein
MPDDVPRGMSLYCMFQVLIPLPIILVGGLLLEQSWRLGYLVGPAVAAVALVLNNVMTPEAKADSVGKLDVTRPARLPPGRRSRSVNGVTGSIRIPARPAPRQMPCAA